MIDPAGSVVRFGRMICRLFCVAFALALTACSPATEAPAGSADTEELTSELISLADPAPEKSSVSARETVISALATDSAEMQEAASVSQLHLLPESDAKVLSLSNGDPAANGLVTYLALFVSPAEGWRLYPIGDFAAWRVTDSAPGRVRIDYRQDAFGPAGDIVQRRARAVVEWTREPNGSPPDQAIVAVQPQG